MSFHLILEYYGGLSVLVLSTKHIARFKTFPKWSKLRGLSLSEWIDIGWRSSIGKTWQK